MPTREQTRVWRVGVSTLTNVTGNRQQATLVKVNTRSVLGKLYLEFSKGDPRPPSRADRLKVLKHARAMF